jgi:hypothetical protein
MQAAARREICRAVVVSAARLVPDMIDGELWKTPPLHPFYFEAVFSGNAVCDDSWNFDCQLPVDGPCDFCSGTG